ncbi:hypothetical protein J6590_018264 [Homalodisca vitripennis]|nr:hypothetical protein J6590_018264 [Homalodisca vitripennis]
MVSLHTSARFLYRNHHVFYRYQNSFELPTKILLSNDKCRKSLYTNNVRFSWTKRKISNGWKGDNVLKSSGVILALLTVGLSVYYINDKKRRVYLKAAESNAGVFNPKLPSHTLKEVAKHNSKKERVWVTFDQGVYDITDFIDQHPGGGEKIMMAAGGSVEPFWMMYGIHKTPKILALLEQYRIGNISVEDAKVATSNMEDPYSNEPQRHPALHTSSLRPYNAEPPSALLVDSFITPTALFYVRNHLPVPDVDEKSYELEISGVGIKSTTLTLEDIKKFPKHSVTACIQCAGNRRSEMNQVWQLLLC